MIKFKRFLKKCNRIISGIIFDIILLPLAIIILLIRKSIGLSHNLEKKLKKLI